MHPGVRHGTCLLYTDAHCTAPHGGKTSVRGAQNAPGAQAASGGAKQTAYTTPYDPETGTATGPDGRPVEIGSTGGQQTVFGKESWQWLLVGPMA